MKAKEEALKKYRLEVVSECKNALVVQRELVASKEKLLSKAKADAEEAERSAASIAVQLRTAEAASKAADKHLEQVRSELGLLSSKSARRTRGAGMDVQSEEAARRRVALRDEVSAAQVAQSAASLEWDMARDATNRACAKVLCPSPLHDI